MGKTIRTNDLYLNMSDLDNVPFVVEESSVSKEEKLVTGSDKLKVEVKLVPLKEYKDEKYKLYEMYAEYEQGLVEDIITKFTELKEYYQDVPAVIDAAAFAALSNVQNEQEIGKCEDENLMLLPFVCLDGINEKGVSIAVLVVDIKDGMGITCQKEKEKNIFTTLAIRYVLDYADSTASAVELLSNFNMLAAGGKDYHFFY